MSDASRMTLSYGNEVTLGTAPGGAPREFRYTRESLKAAIATARSAEVDGDRMTQDILRIGLQPAGSVEAELSFLSHNDMLKAALWSGTTTVGATLGPGTVYAVNSGASTITSSSNNFVSGGLLAGGYIRVSGFANAGNNSIFKVLTLAAGTITVAPLGSTLVTEAAGASVTIKSSGDYIGGVTQNSLTLEKQFTDNTTDFEIIKGGLIDTWGLTVPVQGICTHNFGFMAKTIASATATAFSGSLVSGGGAPIPAVTGVFKFCENALAFSATGFSLALNNNLRARNVIGVFGPESFGSGTQDITGTLDANYSSAALIDKAINTTTLTSSSLAVVFKDTSGNYFIVDLPAIKFVDAERIGGGRDTDVIARMQWQAFRHTDSTQIRIGSIAA